MKETLQFRPGAEGFAIQVQHLLHQRSKPHYHDELEVNLVCSGHASYLFGHTRVPLPVRSMIWLFPRQEHVLIDWSRDFRMWVVVFRPALVLRLSKLAERRILRSADPGGIVCRQIDSVSVDGLEQVFQGIASEQEDLDFLNSSLGYALLRSWRAFQFSPDLALSTDVHPAVAKAARLVTDSDTPMALDQLAVKAGLSAARLSRLFKRQTGISLTSFRQRKCLERFLHLYRTGARYSLIEAALLAGFGSYPQFHRVFCQQMGTNPAAYKRQVGQT